MEIKKMKQRGREGGMIKRVTRGEKDRNKMGEWEGDEETKQ